MSLIVRWALVIVQPTKNTEDGDKSPHSTNSPNWAER